ncbi:MAG: transcription factor [Gemmatimonadetes bacterium]|nr:MAG: transcription factor [Gemmatimonadota bacterium]
MQPVNRAEALSLGGIGAGEPATAGRFLDIDPETFRTHFNRKPFLFRHHLSDHPLFRLPRLAELARTLPPGIVEYNAGKIPVSLPDWENTPYTGLSAEETVRRIEECGSWMVLKRAEADSECLDVLNRCLDEIEPLSEPLEPGMCEREAAIFVTSPSSITPYHMDKEINFLLQIRGSKTISVFSASDREVLSEVELEKHFTGAAIHRNMVFHERYQERATVFELKAGYGIHIPTTDPHWIRNGDRVSISFSNGFKTRASLQRGMIYNLNGRMRKMGLSPAPYGKDALRDTMKLQVGRALNRAQKWLNLQPAES